MININDFKEQQGLYFKYSGGVKCGNVLRINKKTITVNFPADTENNKLTADGKVKRCNDYHTLHLISEDEYKSLKDYFEVREKWSDLKKSIYSIKTTHSQRLKILDIFKNGE